LGAKQLAESRVLVSETTKKYNSLLTEATKLKAENEEFRKALKVLEVN
jgi:regulator of replication initiation timing